MAKKSAKPSPEATAPIEEPSPVWRVVKHIDTLPCDLTNDELLAKATTQAELVYEVSRLEEEKKSRASAYKSEIEERESKIGRLGTEIREKREFRNVPCEWRFGLPDANSKQLIRLDTGAVVKTVIISDDDRQLHLALQEEQREKEREAAEKSEPLTEKDNDDLLAAHDRAHEVVQQANLKRAKAIAEEMA